VRALVLVATLAFPGLLAAPSLAFHGTACSADAAEPAFNFAGAAFVFGGGTTDDSTAKVEAVLGPGPHTMVLEVTKSADVAVCQIGAAPGTHDCERRLAWPVPAICTVEGPGDFVIHVRALPGGVTPAMLFVGAIAPA
jgi:hypothetical protein